MEDDERFVDQKHPSCTPTVAITPTLRRVVVPARPLLTKAVSHPTHSGPMRTHTAVPHAIQQHPIAALTKVSTMPSHVTTAAVFAHGSSSTAVEFQAQAMMSSLPLSTQARYSQSIGCRHVVIAYSIFQSKCAARDRDRDQAAQKPAAQADPLAPALRLKQQMQTAKPQHDTPMHAQTILAAPPPHQPFPSLPFRHPPPMLHLSPAEQLHLLQRLHSINSGQTSSSFGLGFDLGFGFQPAATTPLAARPLIQAARVLHSPANPGFPAQAATIQTRPSFPHAVTVAASATTMGGQKKKSVSGAHALLPPVHPPHLVSSTFSTSSLSLPSAINLSIHSSSMRMPATPDHPLVHAALPVAASFMPATPAVAPSHASKTASSSAMQSHPSIAQTTQ
jgi:hypothetical protein